MKKIEDLNYYELLEISPTASAQEIHRAYERIRRVYEPNSLALYSLFSPEETEAIQQRVEEAYRTLVYEDNRRRYDLSLRSQEEPIAPQPAPLPQVPPTYEHRPTQPALALPAENRYLRADPRQPAAPAPTAEPKPARQETAPATVAPFIGEFTGPAIKALREQRGLDLRTLADRTKVAQRYLEFIEEENFAKLPVRTYLRGFLVLYAKALGCDPERMAGDYVRRYEAATKPAVKK